jgi:Ca-activated chloride channel homolog
MGNYLFEEELGLLALILIPLIIYVYMKWIHKSYPTFLLSQVPVSNLKGFLLSPPGVLAVLRLCTLIFIILALADLSFKKSSSVKIPAAEIDIVLALDISGSMMIEDLKPNRLEALKDVLGSFIAGRPRDRIGIVLYAGESIYWCPLTKSTFFLLGKLNEMENEVLSDGTAIGLGLTSAVNALRESKAKNKVIVLLTDGENNTGFIHPLTAAKLARKYKIKVYTIGVGTNGTAPFPLVDLDGNRVYHQVPVKLDEKMLKEIAGSTGGSYYRAQNTKALEKIYSEIDKVEVTKTRTVRQVHTESQYRIFLLIAFALLIAEIILRYTSFKTLAS